MLPVEAIRYLTVAIHDVSPATWPQCESLLRTIAEVAHIPVNLLIIPAYHHHLPTDSARYERMLEQRIVRGDELVLHGYTHLDEGWAPSTWQEKFVRQIFTRGEAEFAALGHAEACRRLAWGMEWFERRQWPVQGFVAPSWMLGAGVWSALEKFPFQYTTTFSRVHFLPERASLFAPTMVYTTRGAWGRNGARCANTLCATALRTAPLLRLALHPADADHPRTVDHLRRLLEKLLESRMAVTKYRFIQQWRRDVLAPAGSAAGTATTASSNSASMTIENAGPAIHNI